MTPFAYILLVYSAAVTLLLFYVVETGRDRSSRLQVAEMERNSLRHARSAVLAPWAVPPVVKMRPWADPDLPPEHTTAPVGAMPATMPEPVEPDTREVVLGDQPDPEPEPPAAPAWIDPTTPAGRDLLACLGTGERKALVDV